jgi:Rrf2 family protein
MIKVLKITKKMEYALIVLKYMGEKPHGDFHSAREICDQFKLPFDTTAKVMQSMNNSGILNSLQGANGGYQISKNLNQITYLELEEVIEGKTRDFYCESAKGLCYLHPSCNIINPVARLNRKIKNFLSDLTIEDLLFENILENEILSKGASV